jgi:hypothetical protein
MIAVAPFIEGGGPFPTTFWLTCPRLADAVHDLESAGVHAQWARRAEAEPELAAALMAADREYREARKREGGGVDACGDVGVAGQRDALAVKCLHARVAAFFAGIGDPIGAAVAAETEHVMRSCTESRCAAGDAAMAVRPERCDGDDHGLGNAR